MDSVTLDTPRLARLVAQSRSKPVDSQESCDLCAAVIARDHGHLLDVGAREVLCACPACALLFDRRVASNGHYRLIPRRRHLLERFVLDDAAWEDLRIPVGIAFFIRDSGEDRPMAFYPGPMGATESLLELSSWDRLVRVNPVLDELEPDVEALLVNRAKGASEYFLVPIDDCFRLVAVMRESWRGFNGSRETWQAVASYFADLRAQASDQPPTETGES